MSRIHFLQTKETMIGVSLLVGLVVLFVINMYFIISSMILAYGAKSVSKEAQNIDDSMLSQAIKIIATQE